jgi:hypothetical protein
MMKKIYVYLLVLLLIGCGHIPPSSHKEVSAQDLAFINTKMIEMNFYRIYLCQGKSYIRKPGGRVSEGWVQPKNAQINVFDSTAKIATINYDETIILDFSKEKVLNFDWKFQITNSKIIDGTIELSPLDPFFTNNKVNIINKRVHWVDNWIDLPDLYDSGRLNRIYEIETSASNSFCEDRRIIFYKKIE